MELLIVVRNAADDPNGVINRRFRYSDRLEAALQGGVFFDILAVFVKGSGTNDLDLAPGQGGFQNICGVHRSFCITSAHHIVHLINDQDNVACLGHL